VAGVISDIQAARQILDDELKARFTEAAVQGWTEYHYPDLAARLRILRSLNLIRWYSLRY